MAREREFDLILWGATGFTGELVAEYLAAHPDTRKLRWALGGRSESKLRRLRDKLAAAWPSAGQIPLVVGDAMNADDMRHVAESTRVVATLVGPFVKYGEPLLAACAEAGTHYCDTTGEPHWVRAMAERHGAAAERSGARIVSCCGFDSVPSDLGTFALQAYSLEHFGVACDEVKALQRMGGSPMLSGGTIDSMLTLAKQLAKDPSLAAELKDPYSLDPPGKRGTGANVEEIYAPVYDHARRTWTAPFVMAVINERVVRRSNALLGHRFGRGMRYVERTPTGKGPTGFLIASAVGAGLKSVLPLLGVAPLRAFARRFVLPRPGEGPSALQRAKGWFCLDLRGRTADGSVVLRAKVGADGDPGYGETATMFGEAALCLALDKLRSSPGVTTPAAAMGHALIERLRGARHTYDIEVEAAEPRRLAEATRRQQAQSMAN